MRNVVCRIDPYGGLLRVDFQGFLSWVVEDAEEYWWRKETTEFKDRRQFLSLLKPGFDTFAVLRKNTWPTQNESPDAKPNLSSKLGGWWAELARCSHPQLGFATISSAQLAVGINVAIERGISCIGENLRSECYPGAWLSKSDEFSLKGSSISFPSLRHKILFSHNSPEFLPKSL